MPVKRFRYENLSRSSLFRHKAVARRQNLRDKHCNEDYSLSNKKNTQNNVEDEGINFIIL